MRSQNLATLGGDDIIGLERATCFNDPAQAAPGRLGSTNGTASRDLLCDDGLPQQVFPYVDLTTALTVDATGTQTFSLLDSCVADLNLSPTAPFTPAHLLDKKQCVSLARFILAAAPPRRASTNYPQVARRRLENQLAREWLTLHALIARTATQEREYDEIAGLDDQPASDRLGSYRRPHRPRLAARATRQAHLRRRSPRRAEAGLPHAGAARRPLDLRPAPRRGRRRRRARHPDALFQHGPP